LRAVVRLVRFAVDVERLRVPVIRPVPRAVVRLAVRPVVFRAELERLAVILRAGVVVLRAVVLRAVVRLGVRAVVVLRAGVVVLRAVVLRAVVLRVVGLRAVVFDAVVRLVVAFFAVVRDVVRDVPVFRAAPALRVVVRRFVGLAGIRLPPSSRGRRVTALTVAGAFAPYAFDPLARIGRNGPRMNPLDRGKCRSSPLA
jgi:hypothetical protein